VIVYSFARNVLGKRVILVYILNLGHVAEWYTCPTQNRVVLNLVGSNPTVAIMENECDNAKIYRGDVTKTCFCFPILSHALSFTLCDISNNFELWKARNHVVPENTIVNVVKILKLDGCNPIIKFEWEKPEWIKKEGPFYLYTSDFVIIN
jgi:hypothetical protein